MEMNFHNTKKDNLETKVEKLEQKLSKMTEIVDAVVDEKSKDIEAKKERQTIVKDEKLKVFYTTVRQTLNDYMIASKAISSNQISLESDSMTNKFFNGIKLAGQFIPISSISTIVTGIGSLGHAINKLSETAKVKTSSNLFIDANVGAEIIEEVARKVTNGSNKNSINDLADKRGVKLYAELVSASLITLMQSGKIDEQKELTTQLIEHGNGVKPDRSVLREFRNKIKDLTKKVLPTDKKYDEGKLLDYQIEKSNKSEGIKSEKKDLPSLNM